MRKSVLVPVLVLVSAVVSTWAGPLDPPAGPIAGTYKTLSDVEPRIMINAVNTPGNGICVYQINKPGSYYLGASVTGVAGKHGILIQASDVTVDLNGFDVVGVSGSLVGVNSIVNTYHNISVRNGHVLGPWSIGVDLLASFGYNPRIEDVDVQGALQYGMRVGGGGYIGRCRAGNIGPNPSGGSSFGIIGFSGPTIVVDCTVNVSKGYGIAMGFGGRVSGCSVTNCNVAGIAALGQCMVANCSSFGNFGYGFSTVEDGSNGYGVEFINCEAANNPSGGFQLTAKNVIRECIATDNGTVGILVQGANNRVEANHVVNSPIGVQVTAAGNIIMRNSTTGITNAYSIVAGNDAGPVGTVATATSPWANIKD